MTASPPGTELPGHSPAHPRTFFVSHESISGISGAEHLLKSWACPCWPWGRTVECSAAAGGQGKRRQLLEPCQRQPRALHFSPTAPTWTVGLPLLAPGWIFISQTAGLQASPSITVKDAYAPPPASPPSPFSCQCFFSKP